MQTKITIRNEAQTCYIDIEGIIGVPEQNQFENASSRVATYETFRREVARIAEVAATSVVVNIRSTGGDVNDALLIYDALQAIDARITTRCYGYTASAATIIAQAAHEGLREISANALYLIHNSVCAIEGNSSELGNRADLLRKTDERLAQLYASRSGREKQSFVELMAENDGSGRWLTAEETVQAGLADKIIDSLITGSVIPDPDAQAAESTTTEQTTAEQTPTALAKQVQNKAATSADDDVTEVVNSVAGTIAHFLLQRFSYRWERLMDRLRNKRIEKLKAKQEQEQQAEEQAAKSAAATQATADGVSGTAPTDSNSLPTAAASVAAVKAAAARSAIALDEGQKLYTPTRTNEAEDPSMNMPRSVANEKAYDEDVRAFVSR